MGTGAGGAAERRVGRALPDGCLEAWESRLAPTDLQTLLLKVMRARADRVTPRRLMDRRRSDRFVRPSPADPRLLAALEARVWSLVPAEFEGVELSPVAPLGLCSALGPVDQHRIVSTVRGSEVLSDPTNALAVEAALRRDGGRRDGGRRDGGSRDGGSRDVGSRDGGSRDVGSRDVGSRDGAVHVAACHRVLRAQPLGPGQFAHFRLFALVSSARDRGAGRTEAALLVRHLTVWRTVLAAVLPGADARLTVTAFDDPVLAERLHDTVLPAVRTGAGPAAGVVPVVEDADRIQGRGYYAGLALGLRVTTDDGELDIGDGGFTTWTAQLLADAKERCLVSCLATERVAALAGKGLPV